MWFFISCLIAVAALIYFWITMKYNYFKDRGVAGPAPKFSFGNLPSQYTQKRHVTYDYDDIYQEFRGKAPFVGYFDMGSPGHIVVDPDFVKSVLITKFKNFHDSEFSRMTDKETDPMFGRNPFVLRGEEWKEKRAEITPAFTPTRIKAMFPLVEVVLSRFKNYIYAELKAKKHPFDAREICAKFTTDVVSSCVFDADAQSFTKENAEIREMGRKLISFPWWMAIIFILYGIFPSLMNVYKVRFVPKETTAFFCDLMRQAITQREKNPSQRDDFLAYLIGLKNKKQIEEIDMAAHGVTFFTDGFETSSLSIAYTLFELANNPEVQAKLRNELEEIFDRDGNIIYEKLIEHEYLDQVFYESLRLHPPSTVTNRECTEDIELEGVKGKKYVIKAGDGVKIPVYSIQRDADYYPDPEKFNPERFNPEFGGVKAFRDKGVLLPFGDGPRMCLGMRFALMQSKAAIAELTRNFEMSINAKTQQPLVIEPQEFLNVKVGGVWLDFKALNEET